MAASTRQRFVEYEPVLREAGIEVTYSPLFGNDYLERFTRGARRQWTSIAWTYVRRLWHLARARRFDILWIHCELFPYLPLEGLARGIRRPIVFDYDDAIFHMYDVPDRRGISRILGRKLEPLLSAASACCCGNPYLRDYAARLCANSIILPTIVDTDVYVPRAKTQQEGPPVIGWIGSPSTWRMMRPLLPLLEELVRQSRARVRVVGAGAAAKVDEFDGLEFIEWSGESEVMDVQSFDIGIMPLMDSAFERGKSGYKLIQYMACGLPVVASPVGVNVDIVRHGVNGYLATSEEKWHQAVTKLLDDPELRWRLGSAGRERAVEEFSLAVHAPRLVEIFRKVAAEPRRL